MLRRWVAVAVVVAMAATAEHWRDLPTLSAQIEAHLLSAHGGRRRGDEIDFSCVNTDAHHRGDQNPSAGYSTTKGVWNCNGCGAKGGASDLARRLGIQSVPRAGLVARQTLPKAVARKRIVVATCDYEKADRSGVLFQSVRCEPKGFYQQRPDGQGGWIKNLDGIELILFRLPELREADPAAPVFIPEGEKDVLRLESFGLVATTNSMGACKWRDSYARELVGRHVVILPDNDDPGRKHAEQVARSLSGVAASVKVIELPDLPPKGDVSDFFDRGHGREELLAIVENASPREPEQRVKIQLRDETKNATIRQSAELLREQVYLQDSRPVILARLKEPESHSGVNYSNGALITKEAKAGYVQFILDEKALCLKYSRQTRDWVSTAYPREYATQILDAATELGFRPITGIVRAPLFDHRTGEIHTRRGYEHRTGYVLDFAGELPHVPTKPTLEQSAHSLERLLDPFRGFIARGTADPVALASAALTAALRPSLPTAPAIMFDGNQPGCGKGLLAKTLSAIATGCPPATISEGHDASELEKRLNAVILAGAPVVLLDNLQRYVGSSALESGLTEARADIRLFGTMQTIGVPWRALVIITANNASLRRDLLRRSLPVRIVVPTDSPETERFDFDPVAEAMRDRMDLLAAAFTVVRGRLNATVSTRTLGSFEVWADVIGGAVEWLLGKSPVILIQDRKKVDANIAGERGLIEALAAIYGESEFYAKEAVTNAARIPWQEAIKGKGETLTAAALGVWLRKNKDRVFGDLMLTNRLDRVDTAVWQIKSVSGGKVV